MGVSRWAPLAFKKASGHFFLQKCFMEEAINLNFNFNNITHYLHPILLCNLYGWQENSGTFVIKKYHGCKNKIEMVQKKL